MERGSTDLSGHFGPSSSHMSLSIIQPSPGKKSVLYSFSATCQATGSQQHASVTQPRSNKQSVLYRSFFVTWHTAANKQPLSWNKKMTVTYQPRLKWASPCRCHSRRTHTTAAGQSAREGRWPESTQRSQGQCQGHLKTNRTNRGKRKKMGTGHGHVTSLSVSFYSSFPQ